MLKINEIAKRAEKGSNGSRKPEDDAKPKKTVYVCPAPSELPNDGLLEYVAIASLYDLRDVADRAVITFAEREYPILKCAAQNQDLFELTMVVMLGVPRAEYGPMFDEFVWNLDRVAYSPFISELALSIESRENVEAANATAHDRERSTYVRSSGRVKEHRALVLKDESIPNDEDREDDSIADEE